MPLPLLAGAGALAVKAAPWIATAVGSVLFDMLMRKTMGGGAGPEAPTPAVEEPPANEQQLNRARALSKLLSQGSMTRPPFPGGV